MTISCMEIVMLKGVDETNWKSLVDTLLGNLNVKYEFEVTDTEIHIKADPEASLKIQSHLNKVLSSSDAFFQSMPYKINVKQKGFFSWSSPTYETATYSQPQDTVEEGVGIFESLFGEEKFSEIALDLNKLFNVKQGATSQGLVLYSKPAKGRHTSQLWHDYLNALLASFNEVSVERLREIWKTPGDHLPGLLEDFNSDEQLKYNGLIQQCFGVIEDRNKGEAKLFFNYGLLYRLVFAPQLTVQEKDLHTDIRIDKQHMLNYVQQLTQDGTLLRVYKENQAVNNFIARPLFFGNKKFNQMPHHYTIIIDRSGSMQDNFADLGNKVIEFIEKMKEYDDKAKVKIVFFDDSTGPIKEFLISESSNIKRFIKSVNVGGYTRLFGTIEDELSQLLKDKTTQDNNSAVVFFTDGNDNIASSRKEAISKIITKLNEFHQQGLKLPKIFTMGIGEYDHEALSLFSKETNSPFIHLQDTKDFEEIYTYLQTLRYEQEVLEFLVSASETNIFSVPLLQDGNVQSPGILIPFQEKESIVYQVKGNRILVRVDDASKVPVATFNDFIQQSLTKLYTIVASSDSPTQKLIQLDSLEKIFAKFDLSSESEISTLTLLNQKLAVFKQKIIDVEEANNHALHESLKSQAQHALGYVLTQTLPNDQIFVETEECQMEALAGHKRKLLSIAEDVNSQPLTSHASRMNNPIDDAISFVTSMFRSSESEPSLSHSMQILSHENTESFRAETASSCVPTSETSLFCQTSNFDAHVFPKISDHCGITKTTASQSAQITSDTYDLNSCQSVEYFGKSSLHCEGENTTTIITPHLPPKPMEQLGANIALGAVLFRIGKDLVSRFRNSGETAKEVSSPLISEQHVQEMENLSVLLKKTKNKIKKYRLYQERNYVKFMLREVEDFKKEMESLREQFENEACTEESFQALKESITHFAEEMSTDFSSSVLEQKVKILTPMFQQQSRAAMDYAQLLTCPPLPSIETNSSVKLIK